MSRPRSPIRLMASLAHYQINQIMPPGISVLAREAHSQLDKLAHKLMTENQEIERKDNVVDLKLITGGKTPPEGPVDSNDWLSKLEIGTVFLIQEKPSAGNRHQPDFNLGHCFVLGKEDKAVFLGFRTNGQENVSPVSPSHFCRRYDLFEIIGVTKMPTEDIPKDTIDIPKDTTGIP